MFINYLVFIDVNLQPQGNNMNKKAILAILLAILMPLTGYLLVRYFSKSAVQMPGRYFEPDSVIVSSKNGKTLTDTIWHKVKNIQFTTQLGKKEIDHHYFSFQIIQ